MGAIELRTPVPGPRSRALLEERRRWVSAAVPEARAGVFIARAVGAARLEDVDGNVLLDLAGGIGCVNAGHLAPRATARAREQLGRLQHGCFMTAPYAPYVALARRLCEVAPLEGPRKAALFNSGAEAVENAVKIARRATGRQAVLALDPGFHGRTLLALTLSSKAAPYKEGFGPFAPEVYRVTVPDLLRRPAGLSAEAAVDRAVDDLRRAFRSSVAPSQVACVVFEPVLGEGGFLPLPPRFVDALARLCRDAGILLVADEVQTGFGRTGRLFACEHLDLRPDLLVLAKSLANGLPLSAVVGRAELMDAPQPGGLGGTFGGNPVACEAALGALEALLEDGLLEAAAALGARAAARFAGFVQRFACVGDARGLGAMQAFELVSDRATLAPDKARAERLVEAAARRGVLVLSCGLHGNVIRTLMPLAMTPAELDEALDVLEACLLELDR
ncbi:MAG: aspartate aminotransferase family protein [Planctomycetes bacterium]|nr:aspartate aminotransferase family protein [Planctomycetota bacterium]